MYVCVCNAVTEKDIHETVAEGSSSMRELRERLGVTACCGRCASCARNVLHEAMQGARIPMAAVPSLMLAAA
jgi:bacterioferritin-associated ferredoxin